MNQKVKITLAAVPCMAVAFLAGLFIEKPQFASNNGLGDVSRAKVYTKSVVELDLDNLQERMLADEAYCQNVIEQAQQMQAQAHMFASLIDKSNQLVGDKPAFKTTVETMNGASQSVKNACSNLDLYVASLQKLAAGEKVHNFEQIYNNALLGYYLVGRKAAYAQLYGYSTSEYLKSEHPDNAEVKTLWGEWLAFEMNDKIMSGDIAGAQNLANLCEQQGLRASEQLNKVSNQEQLGAYYRYYITNQEQLGNLIVVGNR